MSGDGAELIIFRAARGLALERSNSVCRWLFKLAIFVSAIFAVWSPKTQPDLTSFNAQMRS